MSRIDEAMKRSAVADPARREAREGLDAKDQASRQTNEATLERFPRENRPSMIERPSTMDRPATIERPHRQEPAARPETPSRAEIKAATLIAAPRTGARGRLAPSNVALEGKLVTSADTLPVAVEQYRRLAATLHGMQVERGLKTLLVTSTMPQEGKTLTISNLALTLSESYKKRVLLLDADLRRPSIHEVFGLPNRTGLSEGLRAESGKLPVLEISPYLSVVTAGVPDSDPMAKLTSARMKTLLKEATGAFDWVLLDAPPVGVVSDAGLLADLTEGVLLVIAADRTPYEQVQRAISELGEANIIGTVLNRIEMHNLPATTYYHGGYYGERPSVG
jgi:protein-tyrosine kinase